MTGKRDNSGLPSVAGREPAPRFVPDPSMFGPDATWQKKVQSPEPKSVVISIDRNPQLSDKQLAKISNAAPADEFHSLECTADDFLKMSPEERGQVLFKAGESNKEWADRVFEVLPEVYWFKVVDGQVVGGDTSSLAVPTGQEIVQYITEMKTIPIVFVCRSLAQEMRRYSSRLQGES